MVEGEADTSGVREEGERETIIYNEFVKLWNFCYYKVKPFWNIALLYMA